LFCVSCGKTILDGKKFCTNCGTKLDSPQKSSAISNQTGLVRTVFAGSQYIIEQKIVALRNTFGIKNRNGDLLAYVKKQIVSFGPKFWFETPDGTKLGEVHGLMLTVRPTFEIYDAQGTILAIVQKKILKILGSEWWLEDTAGQEIARIKGNIVQHNFVIQSPTGTQIAKIHKKWVTVRGSYGIDIFTRDVDPYIIIAYAIAMDNTGSNRLGQGVGVGLGMISLGGM